MDEKLIIIHGYSDGSTSFKPLRDFFVNKAHFKHDNVFHLEYASMDDEATFSDFADKLNADYNRLFPGERINVACHSTGALVVRAWLSLRRQRQREAAQQIDCPVKRLLMFAPANFGSDLAKMGQSFLGKFRSTFFNSHSHSEDFLESGKHVLQGLEPASPFQWELSDSDLHREDYFSDSNSPDTTCYPFIFAAGRDYDGELQAKIIKARKKPGTDGTVRICGTSLNTRKCTLNFIHKNEPAQVNWHSEKKFSSIPFTVFKDLNHGSIIDTENTKFSDQYGPAPLVLSALNVNNHDEYQQAFTDFKSISDLNYANSEGRYKDTYQQFFFKVRDDTGLTVDDYYIDFYVLGDNDKTNMALTTEFDDVFENKFYKHSADSSCRVLMIKCTNMINFLDKLKQTKSRLVFDIEAKSLVSNVVYQKAYHIIFDGQNTTGDNKPDFLYPNTTTLIDIILNRVQSSKILSVKDHDFHELSDSEHQFSTATGRTLLLDEDIFDDYG